MRSPRPSTTILEAGTNVIDELTSTCSSSKQTALQRAMGGGQFAVEGTVVVSKQERLLSTHNELCPQLQLEMQTVIIIVIITIIMIIMV